MVRALPERPAPRRAGLLWVAVALVLLSCGARPVRGDVAPADSVPPLSFRLPPPAVSMGQPSRYEVRWGPMGGYDFKEGHVLTHVVARGGWADLWPRLIWLNAGFEGALGTSNTSLRGSIGVYAGLPWLGAGLEDQFPDHRGRFLWHVQVPLRRGGLFGGGDLLRVDYVPAAQQVLVGFSLIRPLGSYRMTRPRNPGVMLPRGSMPRAPTVKLAPPAPVASTAPDPADSSVASDPPAAADPQPAPDPPAASVPQPALDPPAASDRPGFSPEIELALGSVRSSVLWMDELLTPHFKFGEDFDRSALPYRDHVRESGHTFLQEDSTYHASLTAAFRAALGGDAVGGDRLAREAERVIFEEVLLPFDQLFGREKSPTHAGGFCRRAAGVFERRLAESPDLLGPPDAGLELRRATVSVIFARVLRDIEDASRQAFRRWSGKWLVWNNRASMVWLPLNYGLRPEQYDTQAEWDALLGRISGEPFEGANTIEYLMLEQFHLELKRMIRRTERYQVTIVHDFRSRADDGDTDIYGWDMVADGYMAAFTNAIHELDRGERQSLPQFFLFLDAHYYRRTGSRPLISFLENLYQPEPLHLKNDAIEEQVMAAHGELIDAIRHSTALAGLDDARLAQLFKVNVSVTNPLDPAFTLDLFRRDHRKLALRDVFEDDPSSGEALFTGQGIGGHYNGSGWEDRSLRVRGSALVQVKTAVRELFLGQGFHSADVPLYLRARPLPADYAERCRKLEALGWTVPVSIVMNATGYGAKEASVFKAALYNLAPPASFLLCYDSLWISEFWAGMFVSAALRGVHVFPVGATPGNSPSAGGPTLHFVRQTLDLVFRAQQFFADDVGRARGLLRVGLYSEHVPVEDFRARVGELLNGIEKNRFLYDLFPMHPDVRDSLLRFMGEYEEVPMVALRLKPRPSLHLKNQLFGTWEAFQVFGLAEWGPVVRKHLAIRQAQVQGRASAGIRPELLHETNGAASESRDLLEAFGRHLDTLSPDARKRVIYTFTTGSQNQDPRAMLLDGEELVASSGPGCLVTGIDFVFILGISDWPTTRAGFDALCPPAGLPFYLRPLRVFLRDQN